MSLLKDTMTTSTVLLRLLVETTVGFSAWNRNFPRIAEAKSKGVFAGLQIREGMRDSTFDKF
jgi:predicted solute-binding protein